MTINTTEQLQSFCQQFLNRLIREDFKDISDAPIESLDINVPRHAIKIICTHNDQDSLLHTIIRILIYGFFVFIKFQLDGYYIPYIWLHENYDFIPQVIFYFRDNPENRTIENRNKPLEAETSFRLHFLDVSQGSAKREIELISNRILLNFRNFKFTKGKIKYSYRDKSNKLNMSCNAPNESEAISLFKNVINCIDNVTFDNDLITKHNPNRNYSTPERKRVFGRTYKVERRRSGVVEFQHAKLHIQGIKPIKLVDRIKTYNIDEYVQSFYE